MAWLEGWQDRTLISIYAVEEKIDVPVRIELDNTLIDFSKVGRNEIRFTNVDGYTVLSHWVEEWDVVNQKATIWVKVPQTKANDTVYIYLYYGNDLATDTSDGEATFKYFYKAEGTTLDLNKWQVVWGSGYEVTGGILRIFNDTVLKSTVTFPPPLRVRAKWRAASYTQTYSLLWFTLIEDNGAGWWNFINGRVEIAYWDIDGVQDIVSITQNPAGTEQIYWEDAFDTVFHKWEIRWHLDRAELFKDEILKTTHFNYIPHASLPITFWARYANDIIEAEWVFAGNLLSVEPIVTVGGVRAPGSRRKKIVSYDILNMRSYNVF